MKIRLKKYNVPAKSVSAVYFPIISFFPSFSLGLHSIGLIFLQFCFQVRQTSHTSSHSFFTINARAPNLIYLVGGLFGSFFKVFKGVLKVF